MTDIKRQVMKETKLKIKRLEFENLFPISVEAGGAYVVTRIEYNEERGEMARIPYYSVWSLDDDGNEYLSQEVNARYVVIVHYEQEASE